MTGATTGIGLETCKVLADGPVKAAHDALAYFGHIDILVNHAGIALIDRWEDAKVADWDATMAVNLYAPFPLAYE